MRGIGGASGVASRVRDACPTHRHLFAMPLPSANLWRPYGEPSGNPARPIREPLPTLIELPYSASRNSLAKTRTTGAREVCQHSGL